jgi:hypothetical protein
VPIPLNQVAQDIAANRGLSASRCIERRIMPSLQPALDVPVGLAVADVIEEGTSHFRNRKTEVGMVRT